jgi:hypothetical protein
MDFLSWLSDATGATKGFLITVLASLVGRLMRHIRQVQLQTRRFWSAHLLWEIPIAIGMGLIADSLATWLGLSDTTRVGFVACVAYLGPHAIDELFAVGRDAARNKLGK